MADADFPLKCIVVTPADAATLSAIADALRAHVSGSEISSVGESAMLLRTDASTTDVRDWLAQSVDDAGACVVVVAFEQWSSRGACVDRAWLGRRGH